MAYNDAIPQPTDSGATSQPQILANFSELKTYLEINTKTLMRVIKVNTFMSH